MKRTMIPLVAVAGFFMIWLGVSPEVEPGSDLGDDRISVTQAQAEKPHAVAATTPEKESSPGSETQSHGSAEVRPVSEDSACVPTQALTDLNQRKKSLDEREAGLQARDQELSAREKVLEERLKQLQAYRDEAGKVDAARKKEFEEKITRTVELLESMNPKAAAQLVAATDEHLAVEAMSRMSTAKLSKIMNIMEPKRSVRLMELLAGKGTPVTDVARSVPETNPKKEEKL